MKSTFTFIPLLFVLIIAPGCNSESGSEDAAPPIVQEIEIDTLTVFTSFDEHEIARPQKITLFNSGDIAISDFPKMDVSVVSPSGGLKFKAGREGRGPGEFGSIHYMYETGQTFTVVDNREFRASRFNRSGEYLNSYPLDIGSISTETTIVEDSVYIAGGKDGKLLKLVDLKRDSTLFFGELKSEQSETLNLQESIIQLKSGEIPDYLKNQFTVRSDGEYIYTYLNSSSDLRKYTRSGDLVWEKHIELPYNQAIFNQYMERAKQVSNGVLILMYILDFKVIDDSIYFLSFPSPTQEDPQLLVEVNSNGDMKTIYALPKTYGVASGFDIDPQTGTMYFANSDYVTTTIIPPHN